MAQPGTPSSTPSPLSISGAPDEGLRLVVTGSCRPDPGDPEAILFDPMGSGGIAVRIPRD